MAKENVKKFFEEVSKNEDLQKQLKKATEKTNADMQKAVKAHAEAIISVAKKVGFDFTVQELFASAQQGDKKLDVDELDAVAGGAQAGGGGICIVIGFSNIMGGEYYGAGADACAYPNGDGIGAVACAVLGVGLGAIG